MKIGPLPVSPPGEGGGESTTSKNVRPFAMGYGEVAKICASTHYKLKRPSFYLVPCSLFTTGFYSNLTPECTYLHDVRMPIRPPSQGRGERVRRRKGCARQPAPATTFKPSQKQRASKASIALFDKCIEGIWFNAMTEREGKVIIERAWNSSLDKKDADRNVTLFRFCKQCLKRYTPVR